MTIRNVLEADWNVDRIDVTVRDGKTHYIMGYAIGRDVKPSIHDRLCHEAECGDVYEYSGMRTLYVKRAIQHFHLEGLPASQSGLHGVLLGKIPKKLLDLTVGIMLPGGCGPNDLHGYRFDCCVDEWSGIDGEDGHADAD